MSTPRRPRTAEELQAGATAACEELPGAEMSHPFGPEWDVWKVRGRVFMLQGEREGVGHVTVKAHPDDVRALSKGVDGVTRGYHMSKKHWITLEPSPELDAELIAELIADLVAELIAGLIADLVAESYCLVVEKLPKRERPVDPEAFGRRRREARERPS